MDGSLGSKATYNPVFFCGMRCKGLEIAVS